MKTIFLLLLFLGTIANSQVVSPYPNFGNSNGFAVLPQDTTGDSKIITKLQSDGKILVSGNRINGSNFREDFIARFNANGTIDTSFATNGYYIFDYTNDINGPLFFVLQNQETISIVSGDNVAEIVNLDTNGNLDATFGNNGKMTIPFFTFRDESPFLDADENLYAIFSPTIMTGGLAKINTNLGEIDTSFGINGYLTLGNLGNVDIIYQLDNNKIWGSTYGVNDFGVTRFNIDGSIDTAFGINGYVPFFTFASIDELDTIVSDVAFDAEGNIYIP